MGLDAQVRCRCIQDGLANPHPFPERLALDETIEPYLTGSPTLDDWLVHDRWFRESCQHGGYMCEERLGNIDAIAHVRGTLQRLEGESTPRFPVLLGKVVFNGVHTGDYLPVDRSPELLKEVEQASTFRTKFDVCDQEFFASLKRLCKASLETRNPIVF